MRVNAMVFRLSTKPDAFDGTIATYNKNIQLGVQSLERAILCRDLSLGKLFLCSRCGKLSKSNLQNRGRDFCSFRCAFPEAFK